MHRRRNTQDAVRSAAAVAGCSSGAVALMLRRALRSSCEWVAPQTADVALFEGTAVLWFLPLDGCSRCGERAPPLPLFGSPFPVNFRTLSHSTIFEWYCTSPPPPFFFTLHNSVSFLILCLSKEVLPTMLRLTAFVFGPLRRKSLQCKTAKRGKPRSRKAKPSPARTKGARVDAPSLTVTAKPADHSPPLASTGSLTITTSLGTSTHQRCADNDRRSAPLLQRHYANASLTLRWHEACSIPQPLPNNTETICVVYSHTDMRVHDHYPLALAARRAKSLGLPLVAVLPLDVRMFAQPSRLIGCHRQSPMRATFTLENVAALRSELHAVGVPLLVRYGFPELLLPKLLIELSCKDCFLSTQYAPHEKVIHDSLLDASLKGQCRIRRTLNQQDREGCLDEDIVPFHCSVQSVWGSTLVHIDDLLTPVSAMREGFRWYHDDVALLTIRGTSPYECRGTLQSLPSLLPFFEEYDSDANVGLISDEKRRNVIGLGAVPSLEDLGYRAIEKFTPTHVYATQTCHHGGEDSALSHLETWLGQGGMNTLIKLGHVKRPKNVPMYSQFLSRISPYISSGAISPRKLYERVREYATDHISDGMTQIQHQEFLLRLSRRDYWHWMGLNYGKKLFYSYGPRPEDTDEVPDWRLDEKIIRKWCSALTGFPFADASMRELLSTGWVAEPGRQALMWLLSRGLGQDWRAAAEWFERCSLDYDPFLCYGNAAYYSQLIVDDFGDPVHPFHHVAHRNDTTGIYIKKWLPQLSKVPNVYIHRPHVMTERMQEMHQVILGKNYPLPVKLWDGAHPKLGPTQLTTYFETAEQSASPGPFESVRFAGTVLPPGERHAAVSASAFRRVDQKLLEFSLDRIREEEERDLVIIPSLRKKSVSSNTASVNS